MNIAVRRAVLYRVCVRGDEEAEWRSSGGRHVSSSRQAERSLGHRRHWLQGPLNQDKASTLYHCTCACRFAVTGKLSGGHQAAVMCLAVGKLSAHEDIVVTGSKDHYIKVPPVKGDYSRLVYELAYFFFIVPSIASDTLKGNRWQLSYSHVADLVFSSH